MPAILERIVKAWALLGGAALGLIVLLTTLNVAGFAVNMAVRPLGGTFPGLPGYEEAVRLLVGPAVLAFFPYCMAKRGHVSVALFSAFLPGRVQNGIARFSDAAMAIAALFFAVMLAFGAWQSLQDGVVTPVLGWPEWPFHLAGLLSLLLWAVVACVLTVRPEAGESAHG